MDLEEAIRTAGAALAKIKLSLLVETLAGQEIRRFEGFEDESSLAKLSQLTPVTWCFCAQDALEPLLLAAIQKAGAQVRFATELVSFVQDETGVTALIQEQKTGIQRAIRATYLLATDGAHSTIRRNLGIGESGRGTIGHYMGIYFKADLRELIVGREFAMCFVKNPAAPGTLSSVNNHDRWVFNVEYEPDKGVVVADFTPARCVELVRTMVGLPDLEVTLLNVQPWEAAVRVADHYQDGRVFLAGDAIHVMPPAGAFGMNTGIQDVHNLSWKLAAVLKQQISPDFLNTYEAERRPVGVFTVEQAALRLDFRGGGRPGKPVAENKQPPLIDDLTMILGYNYFPETASNSPQLSPFPADLKLDGQPGTRAPHVWLEQAGKRISTLDLFGKSFVLLTSAEGTEWPEAARKLKLKRKLDLDIFRIGQNADLLDPTGAWFAAYGVSGTDVVLIRPDGFIGWRSAGNAEPAEKIFEVAFNKLFPLAQ